MMGHIILLHVGSQQAMQVKCEYRSVGFWFWRKIIATPVEPVICPVDGDYMVFLPDIKCSFGPWELEKDSTFLSLACGTKGRKRGRSELYDFYEECGFSENEILERVRDVPEESTEFSISV